MNKAEDLLFKAFETLDIEMLQDAISQGADVNACDSDGYSYWFSCLLERYTRYDEDDNLISGSEDLWEQDRKTVMEILKFASDNGLNLNECDNDICGFFYPAISFLAFGPSDLEFVDFLISIGFDPVSKFDEDCQFDSLVFYLEDSIAEKKMDRAHWLWELGRHLFEKFPKLKESYDFSKYKDYFLF